MLEIFKTFADADPTSVAALVTAAAAGLAQFYRMWNERKAKSEENNTELALKRLESNGTIEEIVTRRTDKLFATYESLLDEAKRTVDELRAQVDDLKEEVRKLQIENSRLHIENRQLKDAASTP